MSLRRLRKVILRWGFRALCLVVTAIGRLLYSLEAHGFEHIPAQGPSVIVARRISRVDFFGAVRLFLTLGDFSGMTGALALCNNRCIANLGRELGLLPTLKGKSLSVGPLLQAYQYLKEGKIIIMADEGEVPWDGHLQLLRSGAAWLALRAHVPVVPMVIHGGYDIWPRWARWPRLTGKLVVRIGNPFYLNETPAVRVTDEMLQQANHRLLAEIEVLSHGYMLHQGSQA
jgi:1-acyl-sn-glycerol-3-phosphate acyltransferase